MRLRANPNYRKLKAWCAAHMGLASKINGQFYRAAGPRYAADHAIVSGIGGMKANGRCCRRGTARLVYMSFMHFCMQ